MKNTLRDCKRPALLIFAISLSAEVAAGSFSSATESNPQIITHPKSYMGNGGEINLSVCITDNSQNQAALEIPVQNAIRTWNAMQATTRNVRRDTGDVPSGFDIESVVVHEIGHCIGLDHTNLGSEVTSANRNFSYSRNGPNNTYTFMRGADNIAGSADDLRDDDVNLIWFRKSNNNPFTIASTVDNSTYSVMLADLPVGDNYAAIAGRDVGAALGFPNTEAVMHQGTFSKEAQRTLGFDDVATFRIGMSGGDETEDPSAGNTDDYTLRLTYTGIQNSNNCDLPIRIVPGSSSFAFCGASSFSSGLPANHRRLSFTRIELGGNINWYFNDTANTGDIDTDDDGLSDIQENASCTEVNDADTDDDGLADGIEDANKNGNLDAGETDPCDVDSDNDNIQDGTELGIVSAGPGTNVNVFVPDSDPATSTLPLDMDSDDDGLDDGIEDANKNGNADPIETDASDPDSDNDNIQDGTELGLTTVGTDTNLAIFVPDSDPASTSFPLDSDSDDDGLDDGEEDANQNGNVDPSETDPNDLDSDNDGIQDGTELGVTTVGADTNLSIFIPDSDPASTSLPLDSDTDDDGLDDGVEDQNSNGNVDSTETDPNNADSDNDNIQDGTELGITSAGIDTNASIFVPDSDPTTMTSPLERDSDGDGLDDGVEDANSNGQVDLGESNPNDSNSPQTITTVPLMPLVFHLIGGALLITLTLVRSRGARK